MIKGGRRVGGVFVFFFFFNKNSTEFRGTQSTFRNDLTEMVRWPHGFFFFNRDRV